MGTGVSFKIDGGIIPRPMTHEEASIFKTIISFWHNHTVFVECGVGGADLWGCGCRTEVFFGYQDCRY
jgi:hypothetical protein